MEVEVKIRLETRKDHDKVFQLLGGNPKVIHKQENVFFDTIDGALGKTRSVMRIRTINDGEQFVLTLKGNAVLQNGISRVEETEESLEKSVAEQILRDPNEIAALRSRSVLLNTICDRFLMKNEQNNKEGWKIIGRFETIRKKFEWMGEYTVELDETMFSFGTAFEIEIETAQPEQAKAHMEKLLGQNDVNYSNSTKNKFVCMIKGSL